MSFVIRVGPAGIPLAAKGKGSVEGVKEVARLGLSCMEVEFVRGVKMSQQAARELGEAAREVKVALTIHAPYFINLASEDRKKIEASKRMIFDSAERGEAMGAEAVAIHASYYGKKTPEETFRFTKGGFLDVLDKMKEHGIKNIKLGVETMAKFSQFGTLDETIRMWKEMGGRVIPYIDWAHLFVRNGGKINFGEVLEKLKPLKLGIAYSHFEGMKWIAKQKHYQDVHVPLSDGPPEFWPLAKELVSRKVSANLVCESPLLDQDALVMKKALEKAGYSPSHS